MAGLQDTCVGPSPLVGSSLNTRESGSYKKGWGVVFQGVSSKEEE